MKISKITIKQLFGIKEWQGDGKNIELVGFEIDTEMYEVSNTRLERERAQLSLFDLGMERNDNR